MKKKVILLLIFSYSQLFYSQNSEDISIKFSGLTILESIQLIENKTSYKFFFIDSWLKNDKRITGEFSKSTLQKVLDFVFNETNINYYITDESKVILTINNLIHESIYKSTSVNNADQNLTIDTIINPILLPIEEPVSESSIIKTIKIGKENNRIRQENYTLSGIVKNEETNEPIADLVLLVNKINRNVVTDQNGRFSIELPYGVNIVETISM